MDTNIKQVQEKDLHTLNGGLMLLVAIASWLVTIAAFVFGMIFIVDEQIALGVILFVLFVLGIIASSILLAGFHILNPNQALVFTLFGKYYGTIKKSGFFYINPFAGAVGPATEKQASIAAGLFSISTNGESTQISTSTLSKKISLKVMTLNNEKQKVNDVLGNPIMIGTIVIWKVKDPTAAVFNVENYYRFLSTQCDSVTRNIARLYPYDTMENDADEKTLRGSSIEIADVMQKDLQKRVSDAGLEIIDVQITHLAYAEEIAAAMLQRQQAVAIIAARQKIVEGAVSMVKMAIDQLSEEEVVVLDEERKAAMVSNLLVVLCGNKDAQPIVNSGSIY